MVIFCGGIFSMVILLLWFILFSMFLKVIGILDIFSFILKFFVILSLFIMFFKLFLFMLMVWVVFIFLVSLRW